MLKNKSSRNQKKFTRKILHQHIILKDDVSRLIKFQIMHLLYINTLILYKKSLFIAINYATLVFHVSRTFSGNVFFFFFFTIISWCV